MEDKKRREAIRRETIRRNVHKAQIKALIVALAFYTHGRPREDASKALWALWSRPEYNPNYLGAVLTVGMIDDILNTTYQSS